MLPLKKLTKQINEINLVLGNFYVTMADGNEDC